MTVPPSQMPWVGGPSAAQFHAYDEFPSHRNFRGGGRSRGRGRGFSHRYFRGRVRSHSRNAKSTSKIEVKPSENKDKGAFCYSKIRSLRKVDFEIHGSIRRTSYIGVGENDDVQTFYYFIESENNPRGDPLVLWLTGGPGCSSLSGLIYEIGPIAFQIDGYNGGLPTLVYRPYSWTKASSIVFVDIPVNAGFSYATTEFASHRSDWFSWLMDHPEFLTNKLYIAGDSYSGKLVPVIADEISKGNEQGLQPWINLQGYLMGNPKVDQNSANYRIPFAHGMGLISDELYQMTSDIFIEHILEPACEDYSSHKPLESCRRRSVAENYPWKFNDTRPRLQLRKCPYDKYLLSDYWANDDKVRNALNVRKGTKEIWKRCTKDLPYKEDIPSSIPYQLNLSKKGYRSLIYSGDHDMLIPYLSTQASIRSLNYSIVDDWRPWYTDGQVAGYTRTYSSAMTFATVKGAGHIAPEYKPQECFHMYTSWISHMPF
ncbi:hypothetical protein PIB30_093377 [Stylosanthes scabra]|uniref:Uncharacterized protein n=1 Tax=Stylosanthes scabra TaxID=79078 RepID=A0ABU6QVS7_9FABA|nr:hypothetical protein [Stylosanthes scabra]